MLCEGCQAAAWARGGGCVSKFYSLRLVLGEIECGVFLVAASSSDLELRAEPDGINKNPHVLR
jgi:hypothetical protein